VQSAIPKQNRDAAHAATQTPPHQPREAWQSTTPTLLCGALLLNGEVVDPAVLSPQ
jgi:hypothetical protein